MPPLILKRGDPSRRRDNGYDVLEDGKVVGRIFHLEAAAPEGRPWMRASGHGGHIERAAHGYEATREAAMAAFAKSWRPASCRDSLRGADSRQCQRTLPIR
jgi:hypothetical protein